jgi:hypothetical protein
MSTMRSIDRLKVDPLDANRARGEGKFSARPFIDLPALYSGLVSKTFLLVASRLRITLCVTCRAGC